MLNSFRGKAPICHQHRAPAVASPEKMWVRPVDASTQLGKGGSCCHTLADLRLVALTPGGQAESETPAFFLLREAPEESQTDYL